MLSRTDGVARIQVAILVFFLVYFLLGISERVLMDMEEKGYFYTSWSLYSRVPLREQREYSALIHEVAGERYSPPAYIDDMQGIVFTNMQDYHHTLVHDVYRLGELLEKGAPQAQVQAARESLDKRFLQSAVEYEIVVVRYNPIERWRTGALATSSLGIFISNTYE